MVFWTFSGVLSVSYVLYISPTHTYIIEKIIYWYWNDCLPRSSLGPQLSTACAVSVEILILELIAFWALPWTAILKFRPWSKPGYSCKLCDSTQDHKDKAIMNWRYTSCWTRPKTYSQLYNLYNVMLQPKSNPWLVSLIHIKMSLQLLQAILHSSIFIRMLMMLFTEHRT